MPPIDEAYRFEQIKFPVALGRALLAVQEAVRSVHKDATNKQFAFNYVSAEAMIFKVGRVLNDNGVVLMRMGMDVGGWVAFDLSNRRGDRANVRSTYALVHVETGEAVMLGHDLTAIAEKARPHDKAVLSTVTLGLGYLLRDIAMTPRGEYDDIQGRPEPEGDKAAHDPRLEKIAELGALLREHGISRKSFEGYLLHIHGVGQFDAEWSPDDIGHLIHDIRTDAKAKLSDASKAYASLTRSTAADVIDRLRVQIVGEGNDLAGAMRRAGGEIDRAAAMILSSMARTYRKTGDGR